MRLDKYYSFLASLSRKAIFSQQDWDEYEIIRKFTRDVAVILEVDIVGFWKFGDQQNQIKSVVVYHAETDQFTSGLVLHKKDAQSYFEGLKSERVVAIKDAFHDPVMIDLLENYCAPEKVYALLDAPVFFDEEMIGVLCCEVKDKIRDWTSTDKFFVMACADFIGRILEASKRREVEHELTRRIILENLKLSEEQLRQFLVSLPLPIMMLDSQGQVVAHTENWFELGLSLETNLIGTSFQETHPFFQIPVWSTRLVAVLNGKSYHQSEELVEVSLEKKMWIRWNLVPWYDFGGDTAGALLILEDITSSKASEGQIRQNAKMFALGEMASGIAHEINNPLNVLKGYLGLLQKDDDLPSLTQKEKQDSLQKSMLMVDRVAKIVQSMKKLSRESSQDPFQSQSVNAIIDEVLIFFHEKCKNHNITLKSKYLAFDKKINCRPSEIGQILVNLLNNALQAVMNESERWIRFEAAATAVEVEFRVIDSGRGITGDHISKIFDPFYTTKPVGEGTGLGLSLSRRIAHEHQGFLEIEKAQDPTTFLLRLPYMLE